MRKEITYLTEITRALKELGGAGSLNEINNNIEACNQLASVKTNSNWKRNVSAVLQRHCSATKSYVSAVDVFFPVYGLGEGYWGLRDFKESLIKSEVNPIDKRVIASIYSNVVLDTTEKESIILSRRGQGIFRERIIARFKKCIITNINDNNLLIASHIKPWRSSNNLERLSSENGLLLSPTFDKLFDLGYITFNNNTELLISKKLSCENKARLNLMTNISYIDNCSNEMLLNLEYHQDVIFEK